MKTPAAARKSPMLPKSPCNWLLTCHYWRTCMFSVLACALPFSLPAGWWGPAQSGRLLTTSTVLLGNTTSLSSKRFFFRIVLPHARLQFGYPDMSYMPICLLSNAYFVCHAYCGPTLRCLACLTTCIRLGVGRLQSWIEHQHPLYQCGHLHWSKTV